MRDVFSAMTCVRWDSEGALASSVAPIRNAGHSGSGRGEDGAGRVPGLSPECAEVARGPRQPCALFPPSRPHGSGSSPLSPRPPTLGIIVGFFMLFV